MLYKIFKKISQYKHKRYSLILALFVLVFVFSKNFEVLSLGQKQLQDQIFNQKKLISGVYTISINQDEYELKKLLLAKRGQCGRLFFNSKNNSTNINKTNRVQKIKVLLKNDFDENQEIGFFELRNNKFVQNQEFDFCVNSDYKNLIFKKDENGQYSSFEISNVVYYPIAIDKRNLNNILTPIVGNTDFSKIIYESGLGIKDASSATKFTRRNQIIGRAFVADSDTISGVDMKLEFTGVGGIGNYYLELREINGQDGKFTLLPDRIAYFGFNKDSAERDLKIQEGIYHIPLAAHLEKDKIYYIGVNNEAVKFNILNTLKVYGGTVGSDHGKITTSIGSKVISKPGNLYLKVYGADYVMLGNEKVLTGAKILDNGDGTGLYSYEQKGSFSDYLDSDQLAAKKNSSIFYDNVQGGVSAKDEDDNAFIYKINTIYPFTKLKIEANEPGGGFSNSLVYYSFDNKNWQEIKSDFNKDDVLTQEDLSKFQEMLLGDGKAKEIYIKVTYNKDDAKDKSIHLFGLKNLKINAQLVVEN